VAELEERLENMEQWKDKVRGLMKDILSDRVRGDPVESGK